MIKTKDIQSLKDTKTLLQQTYDQLMAVLHHTPAGERPPLLAQLTDLHDQILNLSLYIDHVEAASTEVTPPTAESYAKLAQAFEELDRLKRSTDDLAKVLEIATAVINLAGENRDEIASRASA